jgi:hypothetical protein
MTGTHYRTSPGKPAGRHCIHGSPFPGRTYHSDLYLPPVLSDRHEEIFIMEDENGKSATKDTQGPGADSGKSGTGLFRPVSIALVAVFAVNAYIIYFLLVAIPADCARLMKESGGTMSCGIEPGAYVISAVCLVILLVAAILFVKWNLGRCRAKP